MFSCIIIIIIIVIIFYLFLKQVIFFLKGLELVFSQIAQLRDDIYFIENNLNRTKEERFGEATIKPTRRVIGQELTERLLTASQSKFYFFLIICYSIIK